MEESKSDWLGQRRFSVNVRSESGLEGWHGFIRKLRKQEQMEKKVLGLSYCYAIRK